jgi:hypothetical protein
MSILLVGMATRNLGFMKIFVTFIFLLESSMNCKVLFFFLFFFHNVFWCFMKNGI